MKQSYQIRGMYCPNCEKRIMSALRKMDGVKAVRVDYASGRAEIESKKPLDREQLQSALQNLGYELSNGSDELTRAASLARVCGCCSAHGTGTFADTAG